MSLETRIAFEILKLTAFAPMTEWEKIEVRAFYTLHPEMLEEERK